MWGAGESCNKSPATAANAADGAVREAVVAAALTTVAATAVAA